MIHMAFQFKIQFHTKCIHVVFVLVCLCCDTHVQPSCVYKLFCHFLVLLFTNLSLYIIIFLLATHFTTFYHILPTFFPHFLCLLLLHLAAVLFLLQLWTQRFDCFIGPAGMLMCSLLPYLFL